MRHEMLTQRTFLPSHAIQRGYAESAFCDACCTSSGLPSFCACDFISCICIAAADIFALNSAPVNVKKNLIVSSSFFEIYSGKVYDLLNKKERLRILEDKKQQVQIVGLEEEVVEGVDDVLRLIQKGNKCR